MQMFAAAIETVFFLKLKGSFITRLKSTSTAIMKTPMLNTLNGALILPMYIISTIQFV